MAGGKLVGLVVVKNWCELRSTIVLCSRFFAPEQVRFYIFSFCIFSGGRRGSGRGKEGGAVGLVFQNAAVDTPRCSV